jgi:hypothetical protein
MNEDQKLNFLQDLPYLIEQVKSILLECKAIADGEGIVESG